MWPESMLSNPSSTFGIYSYFKLWDINVIYYFQVRDGSNNRHGLKPDFISKHIDITIGIEELIHQSINRDIGKSYLWLCLINLYYTPCF